MLLTNLGKLDEKKFIDTSWDFRNEFTKFSTHGYHTYPAMMIPQIARRLIMTYGKNAKVLLDPFMGSGTALLEGVLNPNFKKAYGIDINPLALLIAKVKTTAIEPQLLWDEYHKLVKKYLAEKEEVSFKQKKIETPKFYNIDFWFKPDVILDLTIIKKTMCHPHLKVGVCDRHLFFGCMKIFSERFSAQKIPLKEFSCAPKLKQVNYHILKDMVFNFAHNYKISILNFFL